MFILIAEDDESIRFLITEFLEDLGHTVKSAENGMELVRIALDKCPDLVVTDLHMPKMAGSSMIAMLDMYPDFLGMPVIIITGATYEELVDMGISKEIPILLKPIDFAKLKAEIEKISVK